jgi:hypothetical protein
MLRTSFIEFLFINNHDIGREESLWQRPTGSQGQQHQY